MAYSYFTKKLLASQIDLSSMFADKQDAAKSKLNTNYSLPQIVDWVKENTNDFKRSINEFIDLDIAIKRLVFKYYEKTNQKNPFTEEVVEVEEIQQPRVPTEVTPTGIKAGKPDVSVRPEIESPVTARAKQISDIEDLIFVLQDIEDNEEAQNLLETLQDTLVSLKEE
jgi:hypothetical protein